MGGSVFFRRQTPPPFGHSPPFFSEDGGVEHPDHRRRGGTSSQAWRRHSHRAGGGIVGAALGELAGGNRHSRPRRRLIRSGERDDGLDGGGVRCGERAIDQLDWPLTSVCALAARVRVPVMRENMLVIDDEFQDVTDAD